MITPTKKLVIHTQYRENYAAHDDNYIHGVSTPHWKNKGGYTYVVYGITPSMEDKIAREGIPTLSSLLEFSNEYAEEFIVMSDIFDKNEKVVEEWENEYVLSYGKDLKQWICTVEREPYNVNPDYDRVSETWFMAEGNTRVKGSYKKFYRMSGKGWVDHNEVEK